MKMKAINREVFLAGLAETNTDADAVYSRKVKAKFDPRGILPVVSPFHPPACDSQYVERIMTGELRILQCARMPHSTQ